MTGRVGQCTGDCISEKNWPHSPVYWFIVFWQP